MVELLFPVTLRQDMRDVIYTPYRSRFKECLQRLRNVNFFVVDVFILTKKYPPVKGGMTVIEVSLRVVLE